MTPRSAVFDTLSAMKSGSRIYVAGHRGLVGSALTRALAGRGFPRVLTQTRAELDEDLRVLDAAGPLGDAEYAALAAHGDRVRRHAGAFR